MNPHELVLIAEIFAGWVAGAISQPVGVRLGRRIRTRRLLAPVRVPVRVRITADVQDALAVLRRAAAAGRTVTIEQRIRAVHPDWTREQVAAEADLIRRTGGLG